MYIVGGWVCHGFNIQHIWVAADVAAAPEDLQSHILVEYRKTNLSVASSMSTLAVYLTCERLRHNMLQVAYVLSLYAGLLPHLQVMVYLLERYETPQYFKS
jgi:hypothetical protein